MTRSELAVRLRSLQVRREIGELDKSEYNLLRRGAIAAYREERGIRKAARKQVEIALQRGDLQRPRYCEGCGTCGSLITAHHPDYSKPLEVLWLCWPGCHKEAHKAGVK